MTQARIWEEEKGIFEARERGGVKETARLTHLFSHFWQLMENPSLDQNPDSKSITFIPMEDFQIQIKDQVTFQFEDLLLTVKNVRHRSALGKH